MNWPAAFRGLLGADAAVWGLHIWYGVALLGILYLLATRLRR